MPQTLFETFDLEMYGTMDISPWTKNAENLTSWMFARMVNRTDVFGLYTNAGAVTANHLTSECLNSHFDGEQCVGLHTTSSDNTSKWLALDLDNHDGCLEVARNNFDDVMAICNVLSERNVVWLLEDSDGNGGLHLWIFADEPVPTALLHNVGRCLLKLTSGSHEVFPKQSELSAGGRGNWLRTPGKHHSKPHWSVFFGESDWLDEQASIDLLLDHAGNSQDVLEELHESLKTRFDDVTDTDYPITRATERSQLKGVPEVIQAAETKIEQEDWETILTEEGWTSNGRATWTRPGKNTGVSATLNYKGNNMLHVFSTAAGLPSGASYGKFRFWAYSRGFDDNNQIEAAKAYLPQSVTEKLERKWKETNRLVAGSPQNSGGKSAACNSTSEQKLREVPFNKFPVSELPGVLRDFVTECAGAIGCDPTMVLMPALAVCAAAVGTSRKLCIKQGWFVPCVLWTVVVGESGSQKSPPFRMAVAPLRKRQLKQAKEFQQATIEYETAMLQYETELKKWKKDSIGAIPFEPLPPVWSRSLVADTTVEALAPILQSNPRGLLLGQDELSAWVTGFDKYNKSGPTSANVQGYLQMYNADSLEIDRKTGETRCIFVPQASLCVCGGIQPDILSRVLTDEHKSNGLQARLLMAYPERQPKQWRDQEIAAGTLNRYEKLIDNLLKLEPDRNDEGEQIPVMISLSAGAREQFKQFVNTHGEEQNAMSGHLASQWSKLEEIPARLGIVLHCVLQVASHVNDHQFIDSETMTNAIAITEWFKTEWIRINNLLSESEEEREDRQLVEYIRRKGGTISASRLNRNRRDIESTTAAESLLIRLVSNGLGDWENTHGSREFVLRLSTASPKPDSDEQLRRGTLS